MLLLNLPSPFYTSSRVDCSSAHVAKWAKRSLEECRIMVGMDVFYYGMAWYGMLLWYSLEEWSIMLGQKGNWWTKWPSPASQSVTSRTWGDGKTCCQKYQHFFPKSQEEILCTTKLQLEPLRREVLLTVSMKNHCFTYIHGIKFQICTCGEGTEQGGGKC